MAVTGDTELQATKAEIVSSLVQRELISASVLAPTVNDVSMFAIKGAETLSFPRAGSFTAENRASGAAASQQALTFGKDTMTLGHRATVSWLIDSMDALESVVDVEAEYIKRAAAAHGLYLDTAILAELATVAVETTTVATAITDAIILEMRKLLLQRKAQRNNLVLVLGAAQEATMLAINKFVTADNIGNGNAISSGVMGTIYGVPVVISTELADTDWFMYEKSAIALGFQRGPMLDERKAPEYGAGSVLKVLDQKFGVKGTQIAQQGVASGKSALVVRNNPS